MIRSSGKQLSKELVLKAREYAQWNKMLLRRQIVWLTIGYLMANRVLQELYTWQDIESLQWQGDDNL